MFLTKIEELPEDPEEFFAFRVIDKAKIACGLPIETPDDDKRIVVRVEMLKKRRAELALAWEKYPEKRWRIESMNIPLVTGIRKWTPIEEKQKRSLATVKAALF
jgi:hypothetical protein